MTGRLLVTLGAVALAALAAVAIRWDDPGSAASTAPIAATTPRSSSPTSTTAATATSSTTSTTVTTAVARRHGPTTTTTAARTARDAVPTIRPGALHRPKPGTYAIRVISGGTTTLGTLGIDAEQWQRRVVGDDHRTELVVWAREGATLASSGEPGDDGACDWDHQALLVPSDLAEGRTWSSDITCASTISGRAVHLERIETAQVSKRARTTLAGQPVDTWVIDRRVVLSIEGQGISTVTDATSTELFAPDLGLPVFTVSRTKVPQPDGSVQTVEASEELLQRVPSPT